jgi:8-oxo-dGTP pyrophosphatase MutT (NUDIX family)
MVRRSGGAVFMGGAHVFPGGTVDESDRSAAAVAAVHDDDPRLAPWRAAALRELVEEAGIWLLRPGDPTPGDRPSGADVYRVAAGMGSRFDATGLAFFSHWVTPAGLARRFDTRFFMAVIDSDVSGRADGTEVTASGWVRPADALARAAAGSWDVPFPTRWHLEILAPFLRPEDALAWARSRESVPRIEPRVIPDASGEGRIVLPGEPGYEDRP